MTGAAHGGAPAAPAREPSAGRTAALALAFLATSLAIYWPSLPGPFVSDDLAIIALNPYVQQPSLAHVLVLFDPRGDMALMSANWAPVHFLAHMLEWQLFGLNVAAYHLTNAVLHAVGSLLLVALLAASGVGATAAALAGVFFLVHPANVEGVAWIVQLKTVLAFSLMLAALLARDRHPALATGAFVLAVLCKGLAAIALPMAFALDRTRDGDAGGRRRRRVVLLAWCAVFAVFAGFQILAFAYQHDEVVSDAAPLALRLANSAAIGMRYLVMAATGIGVSTFHEPPPVASLLDPRVLAGLAAGGALAARLIWAFRQRRAEAAWWVLAAGSYVPVAQLTPFLYPMADRYLYFILPGLLGGVLLGGRDLLARLAPERRRAVGLVLASASALLCLHFAAASRVRAALWVSDARIMADAARNYPDGGLAHYVRARGAARDRDPARAAAELRLAARHRAFDFQHVRTDPQLRPVHRSPEFQALLRDLARADIEESLRAQRLTEADLISLAQAQLTVEDYAGAIATLDRALAGGGGFRGVAAALRTQALAAQAREGP